MSFTRWITTPNPPRSGDLVLDRWKDKKWKCKQCGNFYKQFTPPGSEDEEGFIDGANWHQKEDCSGCRNLGYNIYIA